MDNAVKRWVFDITAWMVGLLVGITPVAHEAAAGGELSVPANDRWKAECGSCHIAYPPQLLPAKAWKRMMSQLDRHFGTDASLDSAAATEIAAFLDRYSASGRLGRGAGESLRITETSWFVHEHGEVAARAWNPPAVKSAADCAACHTSAEQGDFRKRNIRIPR